MEQEVQSVEVQDTNVEVQPTENVEPKVEETKTFTQEEVEDMIKIRLKNIPSKEEIAEYRSWKESQKTPDEIQEELNNKISSLESNNTSLTQEKLILMNGITDTDDIDYIKYKVSKMEGEFEENLKKYLEENPKFKTKEEPKTTGYSQNTTNIKISEEKAYLDKKYANNPYYKA